jgi:D-amino-acid oxidase
MRVLCFFFYSPLSHEVDYIYVCGDNTLIHTYHLRMSDNLSYRVIIVGGGIIGLTTACTLLKEYASIDNLRLTIISETFSPDTTGDISGGFWEPYDFALNDQRMLSWACYTYDIFMAEFFSTKAAPAGVMKSSGYKLKSQDGEQTNNNDNFINPPYLPLVRHYRVLDDHEIRMFDHLGPIKGFVMSSVVTEVRRYLPQLQRFLEQDPRVKFIKKKVSSLNELKDEADVVINCTGLGARNLVGDLTVRPARGQVRSTFDFYFY